MKRLNICVSDVLYDAIKATRINVSRVCQKALYAELDAQQTEYEYQKMLDLIDKINQSE